MKVNSKEDRRKKKIQIEAKKVSELLRIQELEREIKRLRVENELLKKIIEGGYLWLQFPRKLLSGI